MKKIVSLCKRKGFIFPSSEIYGGFGSCYDYGSLGVELKNNIKSAWWNFMVQKRKDIEGLDSSILMSPKVWEASGHLTSGFADPLVECKNCHKRFRADEIGDKCPECKGELTEEKMFNIMMKTFIGPVENEASITYLRGETCQGIYMNYGNVRDSMRMKIPFGIAQIGKAFRNEITPGNFTYRMREFEQMEMQWFCSPLAHKTTQIKCRSTSQINSISIDEWFEYWKKERMKWYLNLGIKKENLRFYEHKKDELAHYAKKAVDIEYKFPFGWSELEGIHNRGDWDLSNHAKHSGRDLNYFDEKTKEKFIPHIIETSAGADRSALVFLCEAYKEIKGGREKTQNTKHKIQKSNKEYETILCLDKKLAPIKVAIFPLIKKEKLQKLALDIYHDLQKHWMVQYDETGAIGRRYRRQDEIGTPFCVTVDFDSLEDKCVTVRDRDMMKQERVNVEELETWLRERLENV